jgi:hypothetical protein
VLDPELWTTIDHSPTHLLCFSAIILGFEIEGSLHEADAAGFAKEAITDGEITERFLEGPYPGAYHDVLVIVACLALALARVI